MKHLLIVIVLFFASFSLWSFEYAGVGLGPDIRLSGERPSNFFVQGEWQPHKVVGTRVFFGFNNGFWVGVAINFRANIAKIGHGTIWDANLSIPFIFNTRLNSRVAFIGATVGTTVSFDIDGKHHHYFFLTPIDILYTPLNWIMYPASGGGANRDGSVSLMCSAGLRFAI